MSITLPTCSRKAAPVAVQRVSERKDTLHHDGAEVTDEGANAQRNRLLRLLGPPSCRSSRRRADAVHSAVAMHGLVTAGLVVASYAALVYGGVLAARAKRAELGVLAALFALQLPMSAATFYGVRVPLDGLVRGVLGAGHWLYPWGASASYPQRR